MNEQSVNEKICKENVRCNKEVLMLLDFQICSLFNCIGDNLMNFQLQNAMILKKRTIKGKK